VNDELDHGRPDPRERPDDPAGTKPKVDSESLVPAIREPLVSPQPSEAEPEVLDPSDDNELLPDKAGAGALGAYGRQDTPHTPRFQFLLGALFALGLAGVAAIVALAVQGTPDKPRESAWSAWRPSSSDPAAEIAEYVGQEYKLGNGQQIVVVSGGPLEIAGLPMSIVLQQPVSKGGSYFQVGGKGVLFRMCGLGPQCSIKTGKPSRERGLLLRREALELALYTFHYTDADNVVAFIPPPPGKKPSQAVFFRRSDLQDPLSRPLGSTLTTTPPLPSKMIESPDAASVYRITTPLQFQFSFSQANGDQSAFLVLKPVA
jgi:hypothetical protein